MALPRDVEHWGHLHQLPEERLVAATRAFGALPELSGELLRAVLPALRSDFEVYETYAPQPRPPLDLAVTALGGAEDRAAARWLEAGCEARELVEM